MTQNIDATLRRRLITLAAAFSGGMVGVIVVSLALGTNVVAGILGTSIAYGIGLVYVLLRYRLTKSTNTNQVPVPPANLNNE